MASDKRNTQLNLFGLIGSQSHVPVHETDDTKKGRKRKGDSSEAKLSKKGRKVTSDTGNGLNELQLVKAAKAGTSVLDYGETKYESPWKRLQKIYKLQLDSFVTVATRPAPSHKLVNVKCFSGPDAAKKVNMLHRIRHNNFNAFLDECFIFEDCRYVVLEHATISLDHIVKSPAYPTQRQLAAILRQILDGLVYLDSKGLEYRSLSCPNILLTAQGDVKITGQENCCEIGLSNRASGRDVRSLGKIAMELMQKYTKDGGAIGVEDLDRWPSDSNAVAFLSLTTSTPSLDELLKHPLLECHWQKEELAWMVEIAEVSAFRAWTYLQ